MRRVIPPLVPGQTFGLWTVVSRVKASHPKFECACSCGAVKSVWANDLRRGTSRSCGCDSAAKTAIRNKKHGFAARGSKAPEYIVWQQMRRRCSDPTVQRYPRYGGRGIRVCERWDTSFAAFHADMGQRPSSQHQIDRINNDGNYEPGNCRWATRTEQAANTSKTVSVLHEGRTVAMAQAARLNGVKPDTAYKRVLYGWTPEEAVESTSTQKESKP